VATVSELVDEVAAMTGEPRSRVNQLARNLIENGWLPKSSGRAIAQIEAKHVLPLFAAVAFAAKNSDAAKVAELCNLPIELDSASEEWEEKQHIVTRYAVSASGWHAAANKHNNVNSFNDYVAFLLDSNTDIFVVIGKDQNGNYSGSIKFSFEDEGRGGSTVELSLNFGDIDVDEWDSAYVHKNFHIKEPAFRRISDLIRSGADGDGGDG